MTISIQLASALALIGGPLQTQAVLPQETRQPRRVRETPALPLPLVAREALRPNQPGVHRPAPAVDNTGRAERPDPDQPGIAESLKTLGRRSVLHHDVVEGIHWVRGATYKASASPDGFRYIPALGPKAPRNFPVHISLESVERDGATFELSREASVSRSGERLTLDRGDVEVRYDLALDQVEQSFAFHAPSGSGDVTLRLRVATELEAQEAGGGTLRFVNTCGGVSYSEAIVLDGAGRRASVTSTWRDGVLELSVPASFVESATGRIVVDPIMGTIIIDALPEDLTLPDLAYDRGDDRYLAVYEERFSATDVDIYSQFLDGITLAVSGGAYINLTGDDWRKPKVATRRFDRRSLVVAEGPSVTASGRTDIVGRFRRPNGTLESPIVVKSAHPSFSCRFPDLGSGFQDSSLTGYCLAYSRDYGTDTDTHAMALDETGSRSAPEIGLSTSPFETDTPPSISRSSGTSGGCGPMFRTAWATTELTSGDSRIQAGMIFNSGDLWGSVFDVTDPTVGTPLFNVQASDPLDTTDPFLGCNYWVTTWNGLSSGGTTTLVAVITNPNVVISIEELQVIEHQAKDAEAHDLVIGNRSDYFIFAYVSGNTVFATMAQPINERLGVTERRLEVDGSNAAPGTLTIASTFSGGANYNDSALLWAQAGGNYLSIAGTRALVDTSLDAVGAQYCYGSPNSTGEYAFMQALGNGDVFSTQQLVASSLPSNSFGFFLASRDQGFLPGAGGSSGTLCVSGSVGRFGIFDSGTEGRGTFDLDPQAIPLPSGPSAAQPNQRWNFQTWYRDSSGGSATSNFSNAVEIWFP